MSLIPKTPLPQTQKRLSRPHGFHHLGSSTQVNDVAIDIPLDPVRTPSASSSGMRKRSVSPVSSVPKEYTDDKLLDSFSGRRRVPTFDENGNTNRVGYDGEEDYVNSFGQLYHKILHFSTITRYFIYVFPLALLFAIPIIVDITLDPGAKIGGVSLAWIFAWAEVIWISLWVSKAIAHYLPQAFQLLAGVVNSEVRKYALVIKALEIPLSLVGWAATSWVTFIPLTVDVPAMFKHAPPQTHAWQSEMKRLLAAATVCSILLLVEKCFIQMISIHYHRRQFNARVKDNKRKVYLMGLLYEASRRLFPVHCPEFQEEDCIINSPLGLNAKESQNEKCGPLPPTPGTPGTPTSFLHNVKRAATSAFGGGNSMCAHSVVASAIETEISLEALARRIWMSMVAEGKTELYEQDIIDMLPRHEAEAKEAFKVLDQDDNGDVSLEEMVLTLSKISRTRKDVSNSMRDVAQAIHVLDGLLGAVVFVACILVFIAFINTSFVGTLATTGTALLSLSFVFSVTCQEVIGSCVFLFIKHPYDVGDRVEISGVRDYLTVEHISLLFSVFKQRNGRSIQFPNIVLNGLWIANFNRSVAMKEFIPVAVAYDTPFDDITSLKSELQTFLAENSRDFYPEVEIDIDGVADLNRLELTIESRHKSNWGNESLRVARRARFMAALVRALRRVPIHPPGGTDALLGAQGQPTYTVALTPAEAEDRRNAYLCAKDAKRLVPTRKESVRVAAATPVVQMMPHARIPEILTSPASTRSTAAASEYDGLSLRSASRAGEQRGWGKRRASHASGRTVASASPVSPPRAHVGGAGPMPRFQQPVIGLPRLTIVPPSSSHGEQSAEYHDYGSVSPIQGGSAATAYGMPGALSPVSPCQGDGGAGLYSRSQRGIQGGASFGEQAGWQQQQFAQQQAMMQHAAAAAFLTTATDMSAIGGGQQGDGDRIE